MFGGAIHSSSACGLVSRASEMNLRFIETFLWVARLGSFSAAAERQNATQASISNRIATLEEELGVQLFERVVGGVKLTSVGQKAVSAAEEIMRSVGAFYQAISDPSKLNGTIRIGTIDTVVHSFLPRLIERVRESYPGISIDLDVALSSKIAAEMIDRKIDLAIIMDPITADGFTNIDLGKYSCLWVASPKLGLSGKNLQLSDVAKYPVLTFSKKSAPYHWLVQHFEKEGFDNPSISNFNSLASILQLTVDGMGVTILPQKVVGPYLENKTLEKLDISSVSQPFTCFAIYPDSSDRPLISIIADMVVEISQNYADK